MNDSAAATALYGDNDASGDTRVKASASVLTDTQQRFKDHSDTLYGNSAPAAPEPTPQSRDEEMAEQLHGGRYDNLDYEQVLDMEGVGLDETLQKEKVAEFAETFTGLGLDTQDAQQGLNLAVQYTQNPADEATIDGWERESMEWLKSTYGDKATAVLEAGKVIIQRDPKLRDTLNNTGIGSHPDVVRRIAQMVVM